MSFGYDFKKRNNSIREEIEKRKDIEKWNNLIAEEEKRMDTLYLQLGKQYVYMHRDDGECELLPEIQLIQNAQKKIELYREQIDAIKGVIHCACGAEVSENANYCYICGRELVKIQTKSQIEGDEELISCPVCGQVIHRDMRFCIYCGEKTDQNYAITRPIGEIQNSTSGFYEVRIKENKQVFWLKGISVLCGIIQIILMFCKWITVNVLFYKDSFSLFQIREGISALKEIVETVGHSEEIDKVGVFIWLMFLLAAVSVGMMCLYIIFIFLNHRRTGIIGSIAAILTMIPSGIFLIIYYCFAAEMEAELFDITPFLQLSPIPVLVCILGGTQLIFSCIIGKNTK